MIDQPANTDKTEARPFNAAHKKLIPPLLRRLDEIEGIDLSWVGGKVFRLAMLKQQGLNVPPGLVLTTRFFEAQIQQARLKPLWAGSPDVAVTAEALNWLADALKTKPLARDLLEALNTQLELAFPGVESFAVRSSVIDEDHRDHTFAGIHLTELAVPRAVIPIAISRCWASALSQPAIRYRERHGMSIQSIQIAILIQPMLSPTCSGVGFTANPITGARDELVIEATWGVGSALVSGEIQPYMYRLKKYPPDYPVIEQQAGNTRPPANQEIDPEAHPLSLPALAELADLLEQVQALMGEPQDIEWARQDQRFFILQTRPVSVFPEPKQVLDQEWTRAQLMMALPELPSPFFGSLLERSQEALQEFFEEIGLNLEDTGPWEKLILGRPYLNVTLVKKIIAQTGLTSDYLLRTLGYARPGTAAKSVPLFGVDWRTAWNARRIYRRSFDQFRRIPQIVRQSQTLIDDTVRLLAAAGPDAPPAVWLKQLRQQVITYQRLAVARLCLGLGVTVLTGVSSQLIAPMVEAPVAVTGALATKGLTFRKDRLSQALASLSRLAAEKELNPDQINNVSGYSQAEVNSAEFVEFKEAFEELLEEYGQQAVYEADPGYPRYEEDPDTLLETICQHLKNEPWLREPAPPPSWQSLLDSARGIHRILPWRIWLARFLVSRLHQFLALWDQLDRYEARAMAVYRRWGLILGQKWGAQGWLERPEDIFWLTVEEIERVIRVETGIAATLTSTVQARKATYQTYAETKLPLTLTDAEIASIQLGVGFSAAENGPALNVVVGLPISPGQARGMVVVVRRPDEFEQVEGDLILVMPSTDPAWLSLLPSAAGLIVETGGLLSHGSVIAREYGLPAVANVPQATQRFQTGDKVLVDGSTGVIQVLEKAAHSS